MFTLIKEIDETTKNFAALLELFDISEEINKVLVEQNYEGGIAPTGLGLPAEKAKAMKQAALQSQKSIRLPGKGRVVHPGAVVRNKKGQFILVKKDDIDPASKRVGDTGWGVEDLVSTPVKTLVAMVQKSRVPDEEKKNLLGRLAKVAAAAKQYDKEGSPNEPSVFVPKDYVAKVEQALAAQKAVL